MAEWDEGRERLASACADFVAAASALDPAARERAGACGTWSAKDVVSHSTGWEREAVARLAAIRREPDTPDLTYDVDAFNAAAVASRRGLSWEAALAELREAHADLVALLAMVTPDEAARDRRFPEWVESRAADFAEHTAQLRAAAEVSAGW